MTELGYRYDDVNLMMSDETRRRYLSNTDSTAAELGSKAAGGAGIGRTLCAIVGTIAAPGTSLVLPRLGLVIVGPIAPALAGVGAGGATGGIIDVLVGW